MKNPAFKFVQTIQVSFIFTIIGPDVFVCGCYQRLDSLPFLSITVCKFQNNSTNSEVSILN